MRLYKILFNPCHYIYDSNAGSEPSWAFNIAHRLSLKYKNNVIVTGKINDKIQKFPYTIIELQKNKSNLDLSLKNAIIFNWQYFLETLKQTKNDKFDILHHVLPFGIDNTFNIFILLNSFFKKIKIKFIIGPIQSPLTYQDSDLDISDIKSGKFAKKKFINFEVLIQKSLKPILTFLSQKTFKKADKIIVINEYTKNILLEKFIPEERIVIISPGIDIKKFVSKPEEKKECVEFITAGYLLKRKGMDVILAALEKIVKTKKNIVYHIVGNGPQRENLETMVINRGLKNYVVFHGFIPNSEIQSLYHKADVFVSMSRSESWGQMYLEAMACGLPIISSKNVGSNEIIKDGEFGFLVRQENVDDLVKKMEYFIKNRGKIKLFGKKARKEVEDKYDWDTIIIPKYEKIYQELLNQ